MTASIRQSSPGHSRVTGTRWRAKLTRALPPVAAAAPRSPGDYRYSLTSIDAMLTQPEPAGADAEEVRDDRRSGALAIAMTALIVTVVSLVSLYAVYRLAVGLGLLA